MKNFLLALFLLPLTLFAQPDDASWLNVTVQTDNYGGESSWEIINSDNNTVAVKETALIKNVSYYVKVNVVDFIVFCPPKTLVATNVI